MSTVREEHREKTVLFVVTTRSISFKRLVRQPFPPLVMGAEWLGP
jgi:hypothetical protein